MLTDEQKNHIREEEVFRREVQRQLEGEKTSTRKTFWELLNIPFALWLLFTVAVGMFGWGYANIQEFNKERAHGANLGRATGAKFPPL